MDVARADYPFLVIFISHAEFDPPIPTIIERMTQTTLGACQQLENATKGLHQMIVTSCHF